MLFRSEAKLAERLDIHIVVANRCERRQRQVFQPSSARVTDGPTNPEHKIGEPVRKAEPATVALLKTGLPRKSTQTPQTAAVARQLGQNDGRLSGVVR